MSRSLPLVLAVLAGCIGSAFRDGDGDSWSFDGGDCDDADAAVHPEATEAIDGQDDDCDGVPDDGTAVYDDDGDGFAEIDGDCDDADVGVHPGADETGDGVDQDCDAVVDEGTELADDDFDGWTDAQGDCDDANGNVYPGAEELCDGVDRDCSGAPDDRDADGDGFVDEVCGGDDCDDGDGQTFPRHGVCTDGRIPDEILAELASSGTSQVCLSLVHNAMTDLPLGDPLREAAVAAQQQAVLDAVDPADFAVTHRFANVNAVCGEMNVAGAIALGTHATLATAWLPEAVEAHDAEGDALIGSADLRTDGPTGNGVVVAVIDTGIDYTHPDLGGCIGLGCRVLGGWDFVNDDADPLDDAGSSSHGTAVAGIIGGDGTATGIVGVAPDVDFVGLKVFDSTGHGSSADVLDAFDWVATNAATFGIRVVNYSGGTSGTYYDSDCSGTDITDTISALAANGVLVVVSSGNNGRGDGVTSPACAADAVAVGSVYDATMSSAVRWGACASSEMPTRGQIICSVNSGGTLDVLAPSYWADTLAIGGADYATAYGTGFSGTSAAAPYVAGAAALLLDASPSTSLDNLRSALLTSASLVQDARNGLSFPLLDLASGVAVLSSFDEDGDGYDATWAGGTDCDDEDAEVSPGADEVCNGIDDDCNDVVDADAGDGLTVFVDADGDGYGEDGSEGVACSLEAGRVLVGGDCDDGDPEVNPAGTEACMDGLDSDCDGDPQDGCGTLEGQLCGLEFNAFTVGDGFAVSCQGYAPSDGCPSGYTALHVDMGQDDVYTCVATGFASSGGPVECNGPGGGYACDMDAVPTGTVCGLYDSRTGSGVACADSGLYDLSSGQCPPGFQFYGFYNGGDSSYGSGDGLGVCIAVGGTALGGASYVCDMTHTNASWAEPSITCPDGHQAEYDDCPAGCDRVGPVDAGESGGTGWTACVCA